MSDGLKYTLAWGFFSVIAMTIAMMYDTASFVDGQYIPVSNDSFYHARRIIDAAISERGLYQFDTMIHVPEGSWVNWPWGYDWLMAMALRGALFVFPDMQPMKFLAHVPVFWAALNIGLYTLVIRELRIPPVPAALALLALSIMPLTQALHGLGVIDHHFIELTFVLLTVLLGLRFFGQPSHRRALYLGGLLGATTAFHNGLFILQIPVLLCAGILWLWRDSTAAQYYSQVALALVGTTLLSLLPAETFRDLQFEFWSSSWFHLYTAICTSVILILLAKRRRNWMSAAIIAAAGLILSLPLMAKIAVGTSFVAGNMDIIANVSEAQNPITKLFGPDANVNFVRNLYSWLILLVPPVLVYFWLPRCESP